jgi:predicted RNase H-like HicB family nuclease
MMMMRQVVIYPDPEDGGWVAEVPSLPGCISQGETKEDVIENVRDAIQTWIEGAQSVGMKVPEEKFDVQLCVV